MNWRQMVKSEDGDVMTLDEAVDKQIKSTPEDESTREEMGEYVLSLCTVV